MVRVVALSDQKMAKKTKDETKKMPEKLPSKNRNKWIAIGIVAVIIAGAVYFFQKTDNTVDNAFGAIDGIPCETQEYSTFHIHAHLDVFVNGQHTSVPQYVGIMDNKCLYWLHTHDTSGVMHIESPQQKNFTLGQFVDIWKTTGSSSPPAGDPIIFVNGQEVTTGLADTQLSQHDEIAMIYGKAPPNIPSFYQFPEGL